MTLWRGHETRLPWPKGKLPRTAVLLPTPKTFTLPNPMISHCLYLISQLCSTQMDTPIWKHSVLLASQASLRLDLPSAYLAISCQSSFPALIPGIPQARGASPLPSFSSLSILSPKLITQSWALNTSCLLIIPRFLSHLQTSSLNSRPPYHVILLNICI